MTYSDAANAHVSKASTQPGHPWTCHHVAAAFDAGVASVQAAAPVRLTDPDDPRIRPGAEVLVTRPYTLVGGLAGSTPNEWSVDGFRSWMRKPGRAEFVLVAEAADPDADVLAVLDAIPPQPTMREWIGAVRAAGIDITKRAVA
jgi:hypothetical protein